MALALGLAAPDDRGAGLDRAGEAREVVIVPRGMWIGFVLGLVAVAAPACDSGTEAEDTALLPVPAMSAGEDLIFDLTRAQREYIAASVREPNAEPTELYDEYVIAPNWDSCWNEPAWREAGVTSAETAESLTLRDLDRLEAGIRDMAMADALDLTAGCLSRSHELIAGPPVTVCLMASYPAVGGMAMIGESGGIRTVSLGSTILIGVDTRVEGWQAMLPYAVAREHFWLMPAEQDPTLLDLVVGVGKAQAYGMHLYPAASPPQIDALTPDQEASAWDRMLPILDSRDPDVIWGYIGFSRTPAIRHWTGNTIGYHIVQAYLDGHPGATIAEWSALDAETLLAESGYGVG